MEKKAQKSSRVISREQAEKEIESWLDTKRIFLSQREENQEQINYLVEAISKGILVLNQESNVLTQTLEYVMEDDGEQITSISYKPRINDLMLKPYMVGVKASDNFAVQNAYIACITEKNKPFISKLDSIDKKIANAIVVFFV